MSATTTSAPVGTEVGGGAVVKVTDAAGRPVLGVSVGFTVTAGNGTINPRVAITDSSGLATTTWTLGTVAGANQLTANVSGLAAIAFSATGTSGPAATLSLSPTVARLLSTVDTLRLIAQALDAFGNVTTPPPTFVVRDLSLLSVDSTGLVRVLRRGGSTYVVATAGGKTDSVLVTVLAAGQSVCAGLASPLDLAVGQVVTDLSSAGACVHGAVAGAEYAIVPYFASPVVSATIQLAVTGVGLTPLSLPSAMIVPSSGRSTSRSLASAPTPVPNYAFESQLRARERLNAPAYVATARAWYASRTGGARRSTAAAPTNVPNVGDLMSLNVNASSFCDSPDLRTGRVAAVTNKAIVVADTANPAGGFTDDEYRAIGVTFDTLVDPTDEGAFGAPSDIDNNGHVILFFTRAVNELTASGSSTITLGFFYQRDLFPKAATPPLTGAACPGSNVAEMFYLLVPDTAGVVNGNKRSKAYVVPITNGTVAHEFQHLINASRRMYVNNASTTTEERWLDEGLAHTAEELNFFAASHRTPRNDIDASAFSDPVFATAFSTFDFNNFQRYSTYLPLTETQAPVGSSVDDDDLPTRGAIWDFLRFAADHQPGGQDNAFWYALVNSSTTGIANLTQVLGSSPTPLLRDWAISVFLDDNTAGADPRFLQPSWNTRSIEDYFSPTETFPLVTRTLSDNVPTSLNLAANGVSFLRFSVPSGSDALITTATPDGNPAPSTVLLSIVRVK
ncbi:MAG TPA: hypothetical protein VHV78_03240 [Gemmatimonadaceae bacterium]|nr:hypothetical protein [Gemmatimonadaceae bacterium]